MLCAGYWVGKTDTCVGDSGGPLVCIDSDLQPHVAGIISWGKGCAKAQYPGIYTRVGYYVDWIRSIIETGGENTPGVSEPIILPKEQGTGSEPEVASSEETSTQKNGGIALGGRMDTDRLNSYMDGIAESGKSLGRFSNLYSLDGALEYHIQLAHSRQPMTESEKSENQFENQLDVEKKF